MGIHQRYAKLEAENKLLRSTVKAQSQQIAGMAEQIKELEEAVEAAKERKTDDEEK